MKLIVVTEHCPRLGDPGEGSVMPSVDDPFGVAYVRGGRWQPHLDDPTVRW